MKIGVLAERQPGETRVALVPQDAGNLVKKGFEVFMEAGAGRHSGILDQAYQKKGVTIVPTPQELVERVDWVIKVQPPSIYDTVDEVSLLRPEKTLVSMLRVFQDQKEVMKLSDAGTRGYALDMMPRTTLAQKMDVLSSMSNIAGYKAVLLAADNLSKLMPMLMTAAGTMKPAKVLVIGAGVAGLQAIATAKRLGAIVEAYDTRPAVKEQVLSLGAKFMEIPLTDEEKAAAETSGGYARKLDEAFYERQRQEMAKKLKTMDIVITTAQIFGQRAPILITADMVKGMPAGSVIVDLAIETGGNCEVTKQGEITTYEEVTIIGLENLPAMVPNHASQMYSRNVYEFLVHLQNLDPSTSDEIEVGTRIFEKGQVVHPMVKSRYEEVRV